MSTPHQLFPNLIQPNIILFLEADSLNEPDTKIGVVSYDQLICLAYNQKTSIWDGSCVSEIAGSITDYPVEGMWSFQINSLGDESRADQIDFWTEEVRIACKEFSPNLIYSSH